MAEAKEEKKEKEEKPAAQAPKAPKKEEAPVEKPKAAPATAGEPSKERNKKIAEMSLKELEEKLKDVEEKMGGFSSHYARQLQARKDQLAKKAKA